MHLLDWAKLKATENRGVKRGIKRGAKRGA